LRAICRKGDFEPPHRHSADGAGISCALATATFDGVLRFEKCQKPALAQALWRCGGLNPCDGDDGDGHAEVGGLNPQAFDAVTAHGLMRRDFFRRFFPPYKKGGPTALTVRLVDCCGGEP
jgi:hypothetical protein